MGRINRTIDFKGYANYRLTASNKATGIKVTLTAPRIDIWTVFPIDELQDCLEECLGLVLHIVPDDYD